MLRQTSPEWQVQCIAFIIVSGGCGTVPQIFCALRVDWEGQPALTLCRYTARVHVKSRKTEICSRDRFLFYGVKDGVQRCDFRYCYHPASAWLPPSATDGDGSEMAQQSVQLADIRAGIFARDA